MPCGGVEVRGPIAECEELEAIGPFPILEIFK
jgi:hypothetical protein